MELFNIWDRPQIYDGESGSSRLGGGEAAASEDVAAAAAAAEAAG